jgi:predicted anti-sigma-YlaC factor YlaD
MSKDASPKMACRELVELVTDYLEDGLGPEDRARFDTHLGECGGCRAYLDQMRETLRALGRIPEETISAQAREELLAAFRDWRAA